MRPSSARAERLVERAGRRATIRNATRNALRRTAFGGSPGPLPGAEARLRGRVHRRDHARSVVLAEQAGRLEDQDQDQQAEDDRLGPARVDAGSRRWPRRSPISMPPRNAPVMLPMPPITAAVNAHQAAAEALEEPGGVVVEAVDQAGRAGQRAAEQERQRDRQVDVDAHHRRRLAVLGGRPHRLAQSGAAARTAAARSSAARPATMTNRSLTVNRRRVDARRRREDVDAREEVGEVDLATPLPEQADVDQDERTPIAEISGARRGALRSGR